MRSLVQIGRSRSEALAGLRHLETHFRKNNLEPQREKPKNTTEKTSQQIQNHFNSHPPTAERIERLEELEIKPAASTD